MIIVRACIWVAFITLIDKQLYRSTGSQGGFSPLALIYYGETNMKKKDIIKLVKICNRGRINKIKKEVY